MTDRILVISWYFPPEKSASGFGLLKNIKEAGYIFDVIYTGFGNEFADNLIMFHDAKSIFNVYKVDASLTSSRDEESRKAFINTSVEIAINLLRKNHYKLLLSHSDEFVSHLAAREIKRLFPHIPWLASYGDLLNGNPYQKYYNHPLTKDDCELEKSLMDEYDGIMVTNPWQSRMMLSSIGKPELATKFHVVPHCFIPNLYEKKQYANEKFLFSHVGMLYKYKRTSTPFIEAIKHILNRWPGYENIFHVQFVGADDKSIRDFIRSGSNIVSSHPAVSFSESINIMCASDALLLRDADFTEDGCDFSPYFSSKLSEYLGAGMPVLAITQKKGFVAEMFANYDHLLWTEENDIHGLAMMMKSLIDGQIKEPSLCINSTTYATGEIFCQLVSSMLPKKKILFVGHKLDFVKPLIDWLSQRKEYEVIIDLWDGHTGHDKNASLAALEKADVIFCEWALGNLKWYSKNKKPGQKLIVRAHAQEINLDHIKNTDISQIDYFITITPKMYQKFMNTFNIPIEKMRMFYNLIKEEDFIFSSGKERAKHLGFIGYVPRIKRLDLAIKLFDNLWHQDNSFFLHIKGKQPNEFKWMVERKDEMAWYDLIYLLIEKLECRNNIIFEPFGDDVPQFLAKMGFIISTSDNEGSHQVVAEGMMAGCIPVIRNWEGADSIYPREFIFSDIDEMSKFILKKYMETDRENILSYARKNFSADRIAREIVKLF